MRRLVAAAVCLLTALPAFAATSGPLTLEQIMANPDWIGPAVENPYWSADGQSIYYQLKRDGSEIRDLYRVDPASGQSVKLSDKALADADGEPVFDRAHTHAAFTRHGDVFIRDLASGRLTQVTRTSQRESSVQWSGDGRRLQYRQGNQWYSYALAGGPAAPVAMLNAADDPQANKPDDLQRMQLRLFKTLRDIKHDKDAQRARDQELAATDPTRAAQPFWLGAKVEVVDTELSPDGRWMLVVTQPKGHAAGKASVVNHYVTDSGYTEAEDARTYVGRNDPAPQGVLLLDLA
ncbi:MAG TPA: S9 family peptidase, partial [Rhodanobacteraceae bacterium]|nr:S9 family peptidase [Rhodanobacteraceae bacterium]